MAETSLYLVDTNVLSNRSDAKGGAHAAEWLRRFARGIRISVVTMAEMARGLILLSVNARSVPGREARTRLAAAPSHIAPNANGVPAS